MDLFLNEIGSVRQERLNGRKYLVAPTKPMRAMDLDQGYVPKRQIRRSEKAWNGTPVTLNHPHDENGNLVSASSTPEIAGKTNLGYLYNVESVENGEMLEGEVWIDRHNAESIGGQAEELVEKLENGEKVSVSTSYFGDRLDPGNYDGEHREKVMGNLRPDHLALLPNKEGRCSIEDGCLAGEPAANSLKVAGHTDDSGDSDEVPANDRGPKRPRDDGGKFIRKDVDIDSLQNEDEIKVVKTSGDSARGVFHDSIGNHVSVMLDGRIRRLATDSIERVDLISDPSTGTMSNRESKIQELVENHGFDREMLEGASDGCLSHTHERLTEDEGGEQSGNDDDGSSGDDFQKEIMGKLDDLESQIEEKPDRGDVEDIASNVEERREKENLIDTVVANSDYSEEGIEGMELSTLRKMKENVTEDVANYAGQIGAANASVSSGDEDLSGWENRVSERMEMEAED